MRLPVLERPEPREQMLGCISWSFAEEPGLPSSQGSLVDLSRSGLGMRTLTRFQQGDRLRVRIEGAWRDDRLAEVRWVRQLEASGYRSGLKFLRPIT